MSMTKTQIDENYFKVRVEKTLFYGDYYSVYDGDTHYDMGFYFGEQADTRNEDSLEKNIQDCIYNANEYFGDSNEILNDGEVYIFEVHRDKFYDEEEYYDYELEEMTELELEREFPLWGMHSCDDTESECVFRCATCSKEEAEKIGLEKLVGKIDYYVLS